MGVEPTASALTGLRSNLLSYATERQEATHDPGFGQAGLPHRPLAQRPGNRSLLVGAGGRNRTPVSLVKSQVHGPLCHACMSGGSGSRTHKAR